MFYISQNENEFGFKVDGIHNITENDIPISTEIHDRFLNEQSQGKSFRIKNINGETFEEIFEEYYAECTLTVEQQIDALQTQLQATDYKIVKCYEYSLCNIALPYDIQALHTERENIRTQISQLENE